MKAFANVSDLRAAARRRLPPSIFDYIDGAAYDEVTKRANSEDFAKLVFRQRVLKDVSVRNLKTTVVGETLSAPLIVAPTGMGGVAWGGGGEIAVARAAKAADLPYTLAMLAVCGLEEVTAAVGPVWFQMSMMKDRALFRSLLDRAIDRECPVLVLTVTSPLTSLHPKLFRAGMSLPPKITLRRFVEYARKPSWSLRTLSGHKIGFHNFPGDRARDMFAVMDEIDPTTTWKDIAWVRGLWPRKLIIKGICDPDDAALAIEHGADAISVSNHGGNMLDGASSTIAALPFVAERVAGRVDILLDGGVRSGQDILKALALGAKACMLGRAPLYGLAAGGEEGVRRSLELMRNELDITAAFTGITDVRKVSPAILW